MIKDLPYKVTSKAGRPIIYVKTSGRVKKFTPEELYSMMLIKIKQTVEAYQDHLVTDAVITVPAHFNDAQRVAVQTAGRLADLNVARLSNEPTAAAIAHKFDTSPETQFLVYILDDTLSIHLSEVDDGIYEILASANDVALASSACLLGSTHCQFSMGTSDFPQSFFTIDTEALAADMFEKTLPPLKRILQEAKTSKENIEKLLVVGSSQHIPRLRPMIEAYLGLTASNMTDPLDAIVIGAAMQAEILSGPDQNLCDLRIDVNPLSLGVEISGGVMEKIILRNTPVPTLRTQNFMTAMDNQTTVLVKIFQGERSLTKDNFFIGQFELSISPGPRGMRRIKVDFEIDANNRLYVKACDLSPGGVCKSIIMNDDLLSWHEVDIYDQVVREAEERLMEDRSILQLLKPSRVLHGRHQI
jgi:heat shock protein 5